MRPGKEIHKRICGSPDPDDDLVGELDNEDPLLPNEINFEAAAEQALGVNDAPAGLTAATAAVVAAKKNGQCKYHASPKLLSQLQSMKKSPPLSQSGGADDDFSFKNIMGMMMMQQAADREERAAARKEWHSQMQQEKLDHELRSEQAWVDRLQQQMQQQQMQMQQQQMMLMMMMTMMGGGKRSACGGSKDEEDPPCKMSRKKKQCEEEEGVFSR